MSVVKILVIPLVSFLVLLYLWYSRLLNGTKALTFGAISQLVYILVQLYRYGLLFTSAVVAETAWPGFVCYYKEYDCEYAQAREKVQKLMTDADRNMLRSQHQVNYIEIYQEKAAGKKEGHVLAGFALQGDAKNDIGIGKVLETLRFKRREFSSCTAMVGTMKKVDEYSGRIAVLRMAEQACAAATATPGRVAGPVFIWEDKKLVSCGAFVGPESKQYLVKGFSDEDNVKSEIVADAQKKTK